jgi:hypothetical protein
MRRSGRFGTLVVAGAIVMAGTSVIASESAFGANGLKGQTRARWQGAIAQLPLPGKGCFTASYPTLAWRAIQCKVAPDVPFGPAVRNLSTPATPIATKPVGKGPYGGSGPKIANTFSLQLNTQFFSGSPACSGSSKPSKCLAWQQFVYTTDSNSVFMQYWLIDYAAKCPSHWFTYETDCYTNSPASTFSGGALTAADLATAKLSGIATQGSTDAVELSNGVQVSSVDNPDSMLDLAPNWTTTEFGVFGDGGGGQAKFGKKTTLEAETALTSSSLAAPECVVEGFTGETNNLKLTGTPALGTEATPTMGSEQTNHDAKNASCVTAPG